MSCDQDTKLFPITWFTCDISKFTEYNWSYLKKFFLLTREGKRETESLSAIFGPTETGRSAIFMIG